LSLSFGLSSDKLGFQDNFLQFDAFLSAVDAPPSACCAAMPTEQNTCGYVIGFEVTKKIMPFLTVSVSTGFQFAALMHCFAKIKCASSINFFGKTINVSHSSGSIACCSSMKQRSIKRWEKKFLVCPEDLSLLIRLLFTDHRANSHQLLASKLFSPKHPPPPVGAQFNAECYRQGW